VFISKRMGYPRISHIISVLQADYPPCSYQRSSCDPTANLPDKGTLSLVGHIGQQLGTHRLSLCVRPSTDQAPKVIQCLL
jgi:hypothetical protein